LNIVSTMSEQDGYDSDAKRAKTEASPTTAAPEAASDEEASTTIWWVVAQKTYPTTYGCHTGQKLSELDVLRQTKQEEIGVYETKQEAIECAKRTRDESCWFEDHPFEDHQDPPYCSAIMENYDNDEEIVIDVLTEEEFDQAQADMESQLRRVASQKYFEAVLKKKLRKQQALAVGEVFYPYPVDDWKIPANLELYRTTTMEQAQAAAPNQDLSKVKSVLFQTDTTAERADKSDLEFTSDSVLVQVLKKATELEEIHFMFQGGGKIVKFGQAFFDMILEEAPHLSQTVKKLSINPGSLRYPNDLQILARFLSLEHLDVANSLEYAAVMDGGRHREDDPEPPFGDAMENVVSELKHLQRLDLGYGFDRNMLKEVLGSYLLADLEDRINMVTMNDVREPDPWPSKMAEQEARKAALTEMKTHENEDIVALAKEELAKIE